MKKERSKTPSQNKDEYKRRLLDHCINGDADAVNELSAYLAEVRLAFSEDQLLQVTLWRQVYSDKEQNLLFVFDQFTDLEQTVMRLLALDVDLESISSITGIKVFRLRHIIAVIREHGIWEKLDGT